MIAPITACRSNRDWAKSVPAGHDQFAREYIASLRKGDLDRGVSALIPHLSRIPGAKDTLQSVLSRLPPGEPDTLRLIGVNWLRKKSLDGGDLLQSRLTYEYQTPSGWGLIGVGVVEELGVKFISGLWGDRTDRSQRAINDFTLSGKLPVHYFVLLLAIASTVFSSAYAIAAALTPMPRRYLWAMLALVGGSAISINWTTGATHFTLLAVNLVASKITRSGVGPWFVGAVVPLGAILTAAHLHKFIAQRDARERAPALAGDPATDAPIPLERGSSAGEA